VALVVVQIGGKVGGQGGRPMTVQAAGVQNPYDGTSNCTVATDWKTRQTMSWQQTVLSMIAHGPQLVPAIVHTCVVPDGPHRVTVFTNVIGTVIVQVFPVVLVKVIVSVRLTANVAFTKSSTPVEVEETNVQLDEVTAHVAVVPGISAISWHSPLGIGAHRLVKSSVWKHESYTFVTWMQSISVGAGHPVGGQGPGVMGLGMRILPSSPQRQAWVTPPYVGREAAVIVPGRPPGPVTALSRAAAWHRRVAGACR
jgi:hypothetical protein